MFIPKPDGSQRPLGVPTVRDRVNQQAIAQVLTPLYDSNFSPSSYGFRAGRNAHQAVRHVESGWKQKRRYAVDCDLKAFFDTVNHDRLLTQLREKTGRGKLLRLIGRCLRAGVELPDGIREATPLGVPQGGPFCFAPPHGAHPSGAACRLAISLRSVHPCWRTSCSTRWTKNSNAAGIISPVTPTTSLSS